MKPCTHPMHDDDCPHGCPSPTTDGIATGLSRAAAELERRAEYSAARIVREMLTAPGRAARERITNYRGKGW
jgi:hypothetical protein